MSTFTDATEIVGLFGDSVDDTEIDFYDIGDGGVLIIEGVGFGEGGFGEGGFGGQETRTLSFMTTWTDIETP